MEAKVGRKGSIKIRGDLPMASPSRKQGLDKARASGKKNTITMEAHGLELRLRNSYTGLLTPDVGHQGHKPENISRCKSSCLHDYLQNDMASVYKGHGACFGALEKPV